MGDYEMAYKYQYNPAATDNVSLHDNSRGRAAAGSLTYSRSSHRSECVHKCTVDSQFDNNILLCILTNGLAGQVAQKKNHFSISF